MDNLKLFGKIRDLIDFVFKAVHLFGKYTKMRFDWRKCDKLILKIRIYQCEGVTLTDNLHSSV